LATRPKKRSQDTRKSTNKNNPNGDEKILHFGHTLSQ
jgi:hypothetical protein